MFNRLLAGLALAASLSTSAAAQSAAPTDAQIAHIAYTAGLIDVAAAQQALAKSRTPAVRAFAETMARDHQAVNDQALALASRLGVTPQSHPTSGTLERQAKATAARLDRLQGEAFDRAYVANEVAFHAAVNSALQEVLIPSARAPELKALLQTGLKLFRAHQVHAEQLDHDVR